MSYMSYMQQSKLGDLMSFTDEHRAEQETRAYQVTQQLAGERVTRGLVRAMLALVQAVVLWHCWQVLANMARPNAKSGGGGAFDSPWLMFLMIFAALAIIRQRAVARYCGNR